MEWWLRASMWLLAAYAAVQVLPGDTLFFSLLLSPRSLLFLNVAALLLLWDHFKPLRSREADEGVTLATQPSGALPLEVAEGRAVEQSGGELEGAAAVHSLFDEMFGLCLPFLQQTLQLWFTSLVLASPLPDGSKIEVDWGTPPSMPSFFHPKRRFDDDGASYYQCDVMYVGDFSASISALKVHIRLDRLRFGGRMRLRISKEGNAAISFENVPMLSFKLTPTVFKSKINLTALKKNLSRSLQRMVIENLVMPRWIDLGAVPGWFWILPEVRIEDCAACKQRTHGAGSAPAYVAKPRAIEGDALWDAREGVAAEEDGDDDDDDDADLVILEETPDLVIESELEDAFELLDTHHKTADYVPVGVAYPSQRTLSLVCSEGRIHSFVDVRSSGWQARTISVPGLQESYPAGGFPEAVVRVADSRGEGFCYIHEGKLIVLLRPKKGVWKWHVVQGEGLPPAQQVIGAIEDGHTWHIVYCGEKRIVDVRRRVWDARSTWSWIYAADAGVMVQDVASRVYSSKGDFCGTVFVDASTAAKGHVLTFRSGGEWSRFSVLFQAPPTSGLCSYITRGTSHTAYILEDEICMCLGASTSHDFLNLFQEVRHASTRKIELEIPMGTPCGCIVGFTHHVFYRDIYGHIHVIYGAPGKSWKHCNLNKTLNMIDCVAGSDPVCLTVGISSFRVFFFGGADRHVHKFSGTSVEKVKHENLSLVTRVRINT